MNQDVSHHVKQAPPLSSCSTPSPWHTVTVLQQVWGKDAKSSIGYFSEVQDERYSTTNIGVPNTERGVCVSYNLCTVMVKT